MTEKPVNGPRRTEGAKVPRDVDVKAQGERPTEAAPDAKGPTEDK